MTREEAIKILKAIRVYECYPKSASEETKEAIDMAIEALANLKEEFESAEYEDYEHATLVDIKEPLKVLVVRCKDCRWWNEEDFPRAFPEKKTSACECPNIYGANFSRYTQEDEFCSRGERREP